MTEPIANRSPERKKDGPSGYRVRVKGCLSDEFLAWLELPGEPDLERGETALLVSTTDQAALYGLINRLRDLGLTLVSVNLMEEEEGR